jgi:hypothetical protein
LGRSLLHSAEEASRRIHSLVEQETDRRVAICLRVRLGGERMTDVAADYGYRDGSGVHQVLQRLEEKAQHDRSLARHLKKLAEQVSRVDSIPQAKQVRRSYAVSNVAMLVLVE